MRHTLPALLLSTIAIATVSTPATAQQAPTSTTEAMQTVAALAALKEPISFVSVLTGAQEVPPVNTPAFGVAAAQLSGAPGQFVFNYVIRYTGLRGAIAAPFAHIHRGAFGTNGPIVHDLDGRSAFAGTTEGTIVGDWRFDDAVSPLTDTLAQDLLAGNAYFNIHTTFSPPGEIRGQIEAVPEPTTIAGLALAGAGISYLRRRQKKA
ncbi:MAG: CHRD domain-containing protein [Leptolyngbyaceae cyanobacterium bins.349]|nr:CHRD domain-containing protein [Leptolyngbyaceae cyanobacterium bins.349]